MSKYTYEHREQKSSDGFYQKGTIRSDGFWCIYTYNNLNQLIWYGNSNGYNIWKEWVDGNEVKVIRNDYTIIKEWCGNVLTKIIKQCFEGVTTLYTNKSY